MHVRAEFRNQKLKAMFQVWQMLSKKHRLTEPQKIEMFEKYLIEHYGFGATARRDYLMIVQNLKNKKW